MSTIKAEAKSNTVFSKSEMDSGIEMDSGEIWKQLERGEISINEAGTICRLKA